jgi:hypothetical protein
MNAVCTVVVYSSINHLKFFILDFGAAVAANESYLPT